ncbi:glutamate 2,3-aminomutase [Gottschalkia purinilytica]|uniref:Glutamate 2,3-aminomutase n=1 Tax=Gottschalkia purinilytica TaxID=1503 RepID=A0A0L0WA19_GOTPU|nr:glutamate 2,3-aminomutase [Gottschalkia purinilytica]KNF08398.1 glutamate 2,3-aminomutase [Gottschalkia purinilytica]
MNRTIDTRKISLQRADELKSRIKDYLSIKDSIPKGLSKAQEKKIQDKKEKILSILNATEEDWKNWKWQLSNRISDVDLLSKIIKLSDKEIDSIKKVQEKYRWSISPYYLALIDDDNELDPIKLQSIPTNLELIEEGKKDPMGEEYTNPAGSITRRYPDRLIINVTNECAMYCRHCQRRRNIKSKDCHNSKDTLKESIEYIRNNPEIRDVLITGGDALALSDNTLDWLLREIHAIPTVDYIRLGTRVLVTLPQRITDNLIDILKRYAPIYINTQFNHPMEITQESKEACEKLVNAGIPLGNQAVLLNGINNDKYVMRLLNHELLKCRVRPYYIFHAKNVVGTMHFNTSVDDGLEIMEYLRGYTSGMAIPQYIVNAPNGNGKTPLMPQYLISRGKDFIKIRTWEGKVIDYPNHPTKDLEKILLASNK